MDSDNQRENVKKFYGGLASNATQSSCCCGDDTDSAQCCDQGLANNDVKSVAKMLGYSDSEISALPDDMEFTFGCGNPIAIGLLKEGETVLDLGSGAGFDCFIAAEQVGAKGHVIGVDMTSEMLTAARRKIGERTNIEFRLGEIEHLPVADNTVDAIISNCVINLSPEKPQVLNEAFRVLKPGGRLAISDIVQTKSFEGTKWEKGSGLCECISGASPVEELRKNLEDAGFKEINIVLNESSRQFISQFDPGTGVEEFICSSIIEARKPW